MWGFLRRWTNKYGPMKLLDIDDMLFPQKKDDFTTISKEAWKRLQEKAFKELRSNEGAHPDVIRHWKEIVGGKVPFGYSVAES